MCCDVTEILVLPTHTALDVPAFDTSGLTLQYLSLV